MAAANIQYYTLMYYSIIYAAIQYSIKLNCTSRLELWCEKVTHRHIDTQTHTYLLIHVTRYVYYNINRQKFIYFKSKRLLEDDSSLAVSS